MVAIFCCPKTLFLKECIMNKKQIIFFLCLLLCKQLYSVITIKIELPPKIGRVGITACNKDIFSRKNPQIITWFSGEDQLTTRCFAFYKKYLSQLCNDFKQKPYTLYLYDLRAWACLKKIENSLLVNPKNSTVFDAFSEIKNNLIVPWELVSSAYFFLWIISMNELEQKIASNILTNKKIWENSEKYPNNNIITKDVFSQNSWLGNTYKTVDTSKFYSPLQYLEGLFLIQKIVQKNIELNEINIIFLLPQEESKYYLFGDNGTTFAKDINSILNANPVIAQKNIALTICFKEFTYTANGTCRPYTFVKGDDAMKKQDIINAFKPYLKK